MFGMVKHLISVKSWNIIIVEGWERDISNLGRNNSR
jgi:hypothetical protein